MWFHCDIFHHDVCSVAQSCPTFCNPLDCIAHQAPLSMEFSRATILAQVAISYSRGSSWPRDQTWVYRVACRLFTAELPANPLYQDIIVFLPMKWRLFRQVGESGGESHIADPHYSWIPFLQIHLLAKMDLQPPHQYSPRLCGHSSTCTAQGRMWVTQVALSWGWMKSHSVLLSQLILQTGSLSIISLVPCVLHIFVCFCCCYCLKGPQA